MATVATLLTRLEVETRDYVAGFEKARKEVQGFADTVQSVGRQVRGAGLALTAGVTLPLLGLGTVATRASIEYEQALAGVQKTTDATASELAGLSVRFTELSEAIPTSASELARLGEVAGQLGVAIPDLALFTETIAALGVSTNLAAEDAATGLARIANVMNLPLSQVERLGSALVALGNNLATTEGEIVDMSLRLTGAGRQVGLTTGEVLALAGAMSSLGIRSEAGGTAVSRVLADIAAAGPGMLESLGRVARTTGADFQAAFAEDATAALVQLLQGLRAIEDAGGNVFAALEELGFADVRVRDVLLRMAGGVDVVTKSLEIQAGAWAESNALANEAARFYGTTGSQLQALRNRVRNTARELGDALAPMLLAVLDALDPALEAVRDAVRAFAEADPAVRAFVFAIAGIAAAVGPVLAIVGTLTIAVGGMAAAMAGAAAAGVTLGGVLAVLGAATGIGLALAGIVAAIVAFRDELAVAERRVEQWRRSVRRSVAGLVDDMGPIGARLADALRGIGEDAGATMGARIAAEARASMVAGIPAIEEEMEALRARMEAVLGTSRIEPPEPPDPEAFRRLLQEQVAGLQEEADTLSGLWDRLAEKGTLVGSGVAEALVGLHERVTGMLERQGDALTAERLQLEEITAQLERVPALLRNLVVPRIRISVADVQTEVDLGRVTKKIASELTPLADSAAAAAVAQADLVFWSTAVAESYADVTSENARLRAELSGSWRDLRDDLALVGAALENKLLRTLNAFTPQGILGGMRDAVGGVARAVGSIVARFNPLTLVSEAITQAFRDGEEAVSGLQESLGEIVAILAQAVQPVLEALVPVFRSLQPVFEELAPIIQAVGEIFAALFSAIAPLLQALVPILRALFPVFKTLAVIVTYVGQVLSKFGQVVFTIASFLAKAVGAVVTAIGKAIDFLPFVSGKGIIRAGQRLTNFGNELSNTADALGEAADAFGAARDTIRATELGDAAGRAARATDELAESALAAAAANQNIPAIFKAAAVAFEVRNPDVTRGAAALAGGGTVATGGATVVHQHHYAPGSIRVDAKDRSARETFEELQAEQRRQNLIATGNSLGLRRNE